ncbi:hypothetical protein VMCG_02264 [Cytospora schulzeri]|uniref:Uncharacterized protein n=1 Tax=Cytospora schulzeri TaxID=448051 RepID=A0A423X0Y8_9PEZI|nr:hypothetical protein VMCG_02264 [Valsa malicola]
MDAHMEGSSPVPVKRGPEDDIQFVSSKPVKKLRTSRESPAAQTQQGSGTANAFPPIPTSKATIVPPNDRPASSNPGVGFGVSQPQPDPGLINRRASLPSMENYVFPQPGMPSRSSRSSPMLSPKQLPVSSFPTLSGVPTTAPSFGIPMQQRNFVTQWQVPGLPFQHITMHPEVANNSPMMLPPIQKLGTEPSGVVHGEEQPPQSSPATPKGPRSDSGSNTQPMEPHAEKTQQDRPDTPHKTPEPLRTVQPFMAHASWQSSQPQPRPISQPQFQMHQDVSGSNNYAVPAAQSMPPKAPCLACEQMRQQAFLNKASGYQGVPYSHVHHGWHGPSVPHAHSTHMPSPPLSSPGFAMASSLHQTQQPRFQQIPQGHVSPNYAFAQVPGQIPLQMTMQRGVPMANMTAGNEPFRSAPQNNLSHHNAVGNAAQMGPSVPQVPHHQYVQNQSTPPQPSATAPPKPAAAAQLTPPSPRTPRMPTPPPPQKHSPNLIVDIAETCEELFPWDQVAKRHGVSRQKVAETFAAIIQLPLLRCTTDKKRHGRLATNRLKDYTRAKNATKIASPPVHSPWCDGAGQFDVATGSSVNSHQ